MKATEETRLEELVEKLRTINCELYSQLTKQYGVIEGKTILWFESEEGKRELVISDRLENATQNLEEAMDNLEAIIKEK